MTASAMLRRCTAVPSAGWEGGPDPERGSDRVRDPDHLRTTADGVEKRFFLFNKVFMCAGTTAAPMGAANTTVTPSPTPTSGPRYSYTAILHNVEREKHEVRTLP